MKNGLKIVFALQLSVAGLWGMYQDPANKDFVAQSDVIKQAAFNFAHSFEAGEIVLIRYFTTYFFGVVVGPAQDGSNNVIVRLFNDDHQLSPCVLGKFVAKKIELNLDTKLSLKIRKPLYKFKSGKTEKIYGYFRPGGWNFFMQQTQNSFPSKISLTQVAKVCNRNNTDECYYTWYKDSYTGRVYEVLSTKNTYYDSYLLEKSHLYQDVKDMQERKNIFQSESGQKVLKKTDASFSFE